MSISTKPDIRALTRDHEAITRALADGVRDALREHKRAGNPIAIWRDGQVVWIPASEISVDDPPRP